MFPSIRLFGDRSWAARFHLVDTLAKRLDVLVEILERSGDLIARCRGGPLDGGINGGLDFYTALAYVRRRRPCYYRRSSCLLLGKVLSAFDNRLRCRRR